VPCCLVFLENIGANCHRSRRRQRSSSLETEQEGWREWMESEFHRPGNRDLVAEAMMIP